MPRADVFIAADIEADGPVPGRHSMLSFGLAVAGRFDGTSYVSASPESQSYYCELQPISEEFDPKALEVSGLDRDRLAVEGQAAPEAMAEARDWILDAAGADRPVMVAWPLAYDWLFLQWYFLTYCAEGSPFGFSSALDMKTLFFHHRGQVMDQCGLDDVPAGLEPSQPHTHHGRDDAIRAAQLFTNLWREMR